MDFLQTSTVHLGWLHWLNYPQFTVINIHFVILVFRPVCQRLTSPVLHPPSLDMVTTNTSTYIHHPDSANVRRTELCVLASLWITFSLRPLKVSAETRIFARVRGEAKSAPFFFARGQICDLKIFRFTPKTQAQTLTRSFERLADVIRSEWTRGKTNQTGRPGDKVSGSTRLVSSHSQTEHENWIPNTFLSGSQDPAVQPAVRSDNYSGGRDPFDLSRPLNNSAFHLSGS